MTATANTYVDPELLPLLEGFPDIPLNAETVAGFRGAVAEMSVLPDPAEHADVSLSEITIPGPQGAGDIRCLLFRPANGAPAGAMLHIHGGGFVMGLPEMDALRNIALVQATGCVILSPDYRLAPEYPHPAPLEDCYAALSWLTAQAAELRFPQASLGVIGESAGGGLAASLALLARDRGGPALAMQVLIYPMLAPPSAEVSATTTDERIGQHIWPRSSNVFGWEALLGIQPSDAAMPPAIAPDVTHLPPAFIAVGELDLFVHDNLAFASRLLEAGVSTEAHLYPAAFHGFDRMADAGVSKRFTADLTAFVSRTL